MKTKEKIEQERKFNQKTIRTLDNLTLKKYFPMMDV